MKYLKNCLNIYKRMKKNKKLKEFNLKDILLEGLKKEKLKNKLKNIKIWIRLVNSWTFILNKIFVLQYFIRV